MIFRASRRRQLNGNRVKVRRQKSEDRSLSSVLCFLSSVLCFLSSVVCFLSLRSLWCALLIFLVAGQIVNATDKDPNDPNEPLRTKSDAIVKEANEGGYGTIVVGRRGLSRVREFFIGRVSMKVIQLARKHAVWVVS